jgi:iron complex outermembrane recepter protein
MNSCRIARVAALAALFGTVPGTALAAQASTVIGGRVVSAGEHTPIAGASVLVHGTSQSARTDSSGRFSLGSMESGRYTIETHAVGYTALHQVVNALGPSVEIEIPLVRRVVELPEVTVVGSARDEQEVRQRLAEVPGGTALVTGTRIRESRQANLKDVLGMVPGVYVQPRFGAADESQLSIRGSGLRNNFHARGINLLINGMPYRNADGFTDFESLDLTTTEAITVYKGGNALRFGGSTMGGAINLQTATGYTAPSISATAEGGSFGFSKGQLASGGHSGALDWYGSFSRTRLDGYRDWSDQGRDRLNAHVGYLLSPSTDLRTFYLFAHVREHLPGSLTESDFETNPRAADPANVAGKWGRNYDLHHVGVQFRTQLSDGQRLEISPYGQYRDIDHPIFQVINQQSWDYGAEVRYENTDSLGGRANRLTVGFQPALERMHNRQFQNVAGEHGDLTKDQQDRVQGLAGYAEELLAVTGRLSLVAGVRFDHSVRKSADAYLADGDQSDRRVFDAILPKVGVLYELPDSAGQLFANASRSSEPPLLLELNSLAVPGFIDLRAQDAWQFEVGTRGRRGAVGWDASVYDIELRNEILNINVQPFSGAPFTVPTYRNSPRTRHYGVELGLDARAPGHLLSAADALTARVAYTYGRNRFVRDSSFAGNTIPGAPTHHLTAELRYAHPSGLSLTPTAEWAPGTYFVNSANTASNRGWFILGVRAEWAVPAARLSVFAAAQNLTGQRRSPSVQVDNANARYFEPMDARSFYVGARWSR